MAGLLQGKVAIVTGAGGGLGEAYAKLFAKEGASVVVNDLGGARDGTGADKSAAQKVVDAITAAGGKAVANGDDVSTVQGGENICQAAIDSFGKVDILVCNAGILRDKTFANTSEADWDAVIKVHLKGTYCCAMPVWKFMKENGGGSMVLTSSTSGLYGNFGQTNYGAAKAGIYGMVRVMSIEGRKYNIRVMGLAPGAYTRMTSDLPGRKDREPDPLSLPENVAPGVLFMVSDLAAEHSG
jgi:NAD(P)-dependent dehydrogenase (short-subunit alcohol dehydrogenase family)